MIGWGEALNVVKELIGKLDVPVQADTQFAIRQLRHARALIQIQLRSFSKLAVVYRDDSVDGRQSHQCHHYPRLYREICRKF
ncbi:MAG: hypothetical protein R3C56_10190 [Pirellulaceae bacterium]